MLVNLKGQRVDSFQSSLLERGVKSKVFWLFFCLFVCFFPINDNTSIIHPKLLM